MTQGAGGGGGVAGGHAYAADSSYRRLAVIDGDDITGGGTR
ncbi:hypothetical protein [endosymbiont of Lamellibrachia barhami]|nr:hypothetical protein [endosymbiont of Lamellibrachia barhami]